jgi:glyoxalase family protein
MEPHATAGLHHVAMVASDLARSLDFYRDALGLAVIGRTDAERDVRGEVFLGDTDGRPGTLLSLVQAARDERGRPGIGGVHHTAMGVQAEDALLKWKRRLVDAGVPVSGPYDRGYFISIYFRDPDGQVLELATAGPGYAIDEPADALGGELKLPPQGIVRGHRDEALIAALTHDEPVPEITADMVLQGIHHVSGITDQLERAGEFYEAALGLKLVKRTTNRDDPGQLHYFWASYRDGAVAPHSSFTLFGWPSHWHRARRGIGQTAHVAFRARDEDDLQQWIQRLRNLDIVVTGPADGALFRSIRFAAPDGQQLEIARDQPLPGARS